MACALCGYERETIRHLIGNCPELKLNRMRNHNAVCAFLKDIAESLGWSVQQEPHLIDPQGKTGVPDLVMIKGSNALIIDVTICYEIASDTLSTAAASKVQKYTGFTAVLMTYYSNVRTVKVYGFPMGARGKWHRGNMDLLAELGVGKAKAGALGKTLSRRVLLRTIDLVKAYRRLTRSSV